jgi:2-keto-3-deoxy-6-phosphogluconate aldolase
MDSSQVNQIEVIDADVILSPIQQLIKLAKIYETRSTFGMNTSEELITEYKILSKWI